VTGLVSIGEIGDELRRAIALLPFSETQQAGDLLDQAMTTMAYVGEGSTSGQFENVLASFAHGRQKLGEAAQTLYTLRDTIEQFIENLGATGGGGRAGVVAPAGGGSPATGGGGKGAGSTAGTASGGGAGGSGAGSSGRSGRRVDPALVAEVQKSGHKISPGRVVRIGRDRCGQVAWLEQGDDGAGVTHLLDVKRVGDFANFGIDQEDIVDVVFSAATRGVPVGVTGTDRVVYLIDYRGQPKRIAVSVGSNGFIVGGNPVSLTRKLKPLS
jgi:hypothetical protein